MLNSIYFTLKYKYKVQFLNDELKHFKQCVIYFGFETLLIDFFK